MNESHTIEEHDTYSLEKLKDSIESKHNNHIEVKGFFRVKEGDKYLHMDVVVEGTVIKRHMDNSGANRVRLDSRWIDTNEAKLNIVSDFEKYEECKHN